MLELISSTANLNPVSTARISSGGLNNSPVSVFVRERSKIPPIPKDAGGWE